MKTRIDFVAPFGKGSIKIATPELIVHGHWLSGEMRAPVGIGVENPDAYGAFFSIYIEKVFILRPLSRAEIYEIILAEVKKASARVDFVSAEKIAETITNQVDNEIIFKLREVLSLIDLPQSPLVCFYYCNGMCYKRKEDLLPCKGYPCSFVSFRTKKCRKCGRTLYRIYQDVCNTCSEGLAVARAFEKLLAQIKPCERCGQPLFSLRERICVWCRDEIHCPICGDGKKEYPCSKCSKQGWKLVDFQKGKNGGVVCLGWFDRPAFPARGQYVPRVGEKVLARIIAENPRKTVYFLEIRQFNPR